MESGGAKSDIRNLTVDEEAMKRNTDCVYFLASPLTCKKGIECEYRHSEGARVNPRDCRFWLSGNCLNPKCIFRHPPLDGLLGNPGVTSGMVVPASQMSPSVQLLIGSFSANNLSRNSVPCYYFQKGACLKGDKCPFMHGPRPAGNPATKQTSKVGTPITSQLETPKKNALEIKECSNQQISSPSPNICIGAVDRPTNEAPSPANDNTTLEITDNYLAHESSSRILLSKSHPSFPIRSSSSFPQPENPQFHSGRHHLHEEARVILEEPSEVGYSELTRAQDHHTESSGDCYQNSKGTEEVFRESSPGFDVLVDNAIMDADYLHDHDDFRNGFIPDERNMYLEHDYDPCHSGYESASRLDMDGHNGPVDYLYFGKLQQHHDDNRHWISERILDEPEFPERRFPQRLTSPDEIDASDLRHRLRKQRRLNGSLSAAATDEQIEHYGRCDHNYQNKYHTRNSCSDQQHFPESTISNRFRGRITLPKLSSQEKHSNLRHMMERGRRSGKIFSVIQSGRQGRFGERLSRRASENSLSNARRLGRKEKVGDAVNPLDFAGPRSLAELKGAKTKNTDSTPVGMKPLKAAELPSYDCLVSFEGPKPLSVLLKRKRATGTKNGAILVVNNNGKGESETEHDSSMSTAAMVPVLQPRVGHEANVESYDQVWGLNGPMVETGPEEEGLNHAAGDGTEARHGEETEYFDHRNCELEASVGVEADLGENEEEDDFAKKIGLIYS